MVRTVQTKIALEEVCAPQTYSMHARAEGAGAAGTRVPADSEAPVLARGLILLLLRRPFANMIDTSSRRSSLRS